MFKFQDGEINMDTEEIRATFKFLAQEKKLVSSLGIQDELFLPFLLSLKSGGPWSYASEEAKSVAEKILSLITMRQVRLDLRWKGYISLSILLL